MKQLLWTIPIILCISCAGPQFEDGGVRREHTDCREAAKESQNPPRAAAVKLGQPTGPDARQFCVMYYTKAETKLDVLFFVFDGNNEISYFYHSISSKGGGKGWHGGMRTVLEPSSGKGVLVTMQTGQGLTFKTGDDTLGRRFEYIQNGETVRAQKIRFGRPEFAPKSGSGAFEIKKWVDMPQSGVEIDSDPFAFIVKQYRRNL